MTDDLAPLRGVFEKMQKYAQDAVDDDAYPASVVSLTAIRETKPDLAKLLFSEAVIAPARAVLLKNGASEEALSKLEEIESRFLQEGAVASLTYEVELLVVSRYIDFMYGRLSEEYSKYDLVPLNDEQGRPRGGLEILRWLTEDSVRILGRLALVRERRTQILLAATQAGQEALDRAVEKHRSYIKGSVMEVIWSWLALNSFQNLKARRVIADRIAQGSDEQIERVRDRLEGSIRMSRKTVGIIVDEIFTGERYIEF